MKKRKTLTPLALVLPGLLATCAYGGYSNASQQNSGGDWSSLVDAATGETYAAYSGTSATYVYRWNQGYDIACGCCSTLLRDTWHNPTLVTASETWSSSYYSSGRSNVNDTDYDAYPSVFGSNGADSQVWATGATKCP